MPSSIPSLHDSANEKVKSRAVDLGLVHNNTELARGERGARSDPFSFSRGLADRVSEFVCSKLPKIWLQHHLPQVFARRIENASQLKPVLLLLILATLYESTDEVCSFLFAEPTNTIKTSDYELGDAMA